MTTNWLDLANRATTELIEVKEELIVAPLALTERSAILRAMAIAAQQKPPAPAVTVAKWLGIGKTTLYRKLREYRREGDHATS